jgi:hypothetical protein
MDRILVLKTAYLCMMIISVIYGFFFSATINEFGLSVLVMCLSASAILALEYVEKGE